MSRDSSQILIPAGSDKFAAPSGNPQASQSQKELSNRDRVKNLFCELWQKVLGWIFYFFTPGGPLEEDHIELWRSRSLFFRLALTILPISFLVFASAKKDNFQTEVMLIVEWINAIFLCTLYIPTLLFTFGLILYSFLFTKVKGDVIGTRTEHLSATIMGLFIIASLTKIIWDPETTGTRLLLNSWTVLFFTLSNIIYVWCHHRIDTLSRIGLIHQTVHFSLSIVLAFTAEFSEIREISKHIHEMNMTMEYGVYDAGNGTTVAVMHSLESFLFSLNFEFHILLANYAYLNSTEPRKNTQLPQTGLCERCTKAVNELKESSSTCCRCPGRQEQNQSLCKQLSKADTLCAFLLVGATVFSVYIFFFVDTRDIYGHILFAWLIVLILAAILVVSLWLCCISEFQEPQDEKDKHENRVILWGACGVVFSACGGIPYSFQAVFYGAPENQTEALTSIFANFLCPLGILFQLPVLRRYKPRKGRKLLVCLCALNGFQFIFNMLEVCQMGVHSSAPEPIVHIYWLILNRALMSAGVFYRLASFLRCVHHLSHSHESDKEQKELEIEMAKMV